MRNFILCLALNTVCFQAFSATPTVTAFNPASAATGDVVTITGTGFSTATAVHFGGTPAASFTIVSATQITATVAAGTSGQVQVINPQGTGTRAGFYYLTTSMIVTDFHGYWSATVSSPNALTIDTSHTLLAFTYNGTMYSTGVNNSILTTHGLSFIPGNFRALPVAGISGVTSTSANSTYLALAKKVDGSAAVANTPAVDHMSVKDALVDGPNGLDLGTGVTNLPSTAVLTFQIFNIDPARVADNEPDIILTQIAQPVSGNDIYTLLDAAGTVIGTTVSQDMILLPKFGSYDLDLFNLVPGTPYNTATAYTAFTANTNREIRVVGLRLSDFGITLANVAQVRALRITPSGNSDYAFIAYNANAINIPPNISVNDAKTNTTICSGGTAHVAVVATAASGGSLTYAWEVSSNGGANWFPVANGGSYSGAATDELVITNATNAYKYRAIVQEAGNSSPSVSPVFTITVNTPAAPTAVTLSGNVSTCVNSAVQLTSTVTGGSNLYYQWQKNISGTYQDIAGAILSAYVPLVDQTGTASYQLRVTSGSGCPVSITSAAPATVTVTGISSVTEAAVCNNGAVTLSATATSGTIDWFSAESGGAAIITANSFTTPVLSAAKTYYVASSGCTSALRVPVTATVYPATAGGTISGGTSVTTGINNTILTLTNAVGDVIKWQASTDNFNIVIIDLPNSAGRLSLPVINLLQTTQYRAQVQSGSCITAFSAVTSINVTNALAIYNTSVSAARVHDGILIRWLAYDQANTDHFEVERSADGIIFTPLHITSVVSGNGSITDYSWLDADPFPGINFYRIKEIGKAGMSVYSRTVKLSLENEHSIVLYPNILTGNSLSFRFNNMAGGTYQVRVINNTGQVITKTMIRHMGGSATQDIRIPAINPGMYVVEITGLQEKSVYRIMVR
jgi:hypothetical protein